MCVGHLVLPPGANVDGAIFACVFCHMQASETRSTPYYVRSRDLVIAALNYLLLGLRTGLLSWCSCHPPRPIQFLGSCSRASLEVSGDPSDDHQISSLVQPYSYPQSYPLVDWSSRKPLTHCFWNYEAICRRCPSISRNRFWFRFEKTYRRARSCDGSTCAPTQEVN